MRRSDFAARRVRRGLTLTELLVAATIMLLIAGAMATLAATAHATNAYCRGQIECAQHARVALARIERAVAGAAASEAFPGCVVVTEPAGEQELPQTLVVWSPLGEASGSGQPQISELVVFTPDPARPTMLLEIRALSEAGAAPAASDTAGWRALVDHLRTSQSAERVILTDQLRVAPLSGAWSDSLPAAQLRGAVRFGRLVAPSEAEFAEYRGGARTWQKLAWPLDSFRARSGTRVVVCQTELQLVAGDMGAAASTALPFFGSATLSYELPRSP